MGRPEVHIRALDKETQETEKLPLKPEEGTVSFNPFSLKNDPIHLKFESMSLRSNTTGKLNVQTYTE